MIEQENIAVISIGSNCESREANMLGAIAEIKSRFSCIALSSSYNTAAINGVSPDYLNAVIAVKSAIDIDSLKSYLKQIERDFGRTPECKAKGIVPMDLDIVLWNGEINRPFDYGQHYFIKGWNEINNIK